MTPRLPGRIAAGLLLGSAALGPAALPAGAAPESSAPAGKAAGLVISLEGHAKVLRAGWNRSVPVRRFMRLWQGDKVRVERQSKLIVACVGGKHLLAPGSHGLPCKGGGPGALGAGPIETQNGPIVARLRGGPSGVFPTLISPRATKLLGARPVFRWTPVAGESRYRVRVRGVGVNWSVEAQEGRTQIAYPADAPPLQPGAPYLVTVDAAGEGASGPPAQPAPAFTLLAPEEALAVRAAEQKIKALGLGAASADFLIAELYASQELNAEAAERLEALAKTSREPLVFRSLGRIYVKIGVLENAQQAYLRALALSRAQNDLEGQALSHHALGLMDEARGNLSGALQRLQTAAGLYERMGDVKTARELQARRAALRQS